MELTQKQIKALYIMLEAATEVDCDEACDYAKEYRERGYPQLFRDGELAISMANNGQMSYDDVVDVICGITRLDVAEYIPDEWLGIKSRAEMLRERLAEIAVHYFLPWASVDEVEISDIDAGKGPYLHEITYTATTRHTETRIVADLARWANVEGYEYLGPCAQIIETNAYQINEATQ